MKQKFTGDDLVLMVTEGIEDSDDTVLATIVQTMLGLPVRVLGDDQFEIDWGSSSEESDNETA